ncbi:hypothetical protein [Actinophytocola glycyrrhizae]|uniref:Uncharacterized protein n=1 Tax=Actinophytocola glycyrrhizae TaxID=2044873 RepID=A0ABV9S127_9PSEU
MAGVAGLMRERLRRLHADGREHTWRAEIRYVSGRREVRVRAWGAGKNGQALQVDVHPATPADEWMYPEPANVRTLIRTALARGWHPETRGGTFTLPPHTLT